MTEYLDPAEVKTLTASCRVPTQANWLKEHGIPHRLDGRRIIISRVHVQAWLEGRQPEPESVSYDLQKFVIGPLTLTVPRSQSHPGAGGGVYALFNHEGNLNYIGQSLHLRNRVTQHIHAMRRKERRQFARWAAVDVPVELMQMVETAHIWALAPPENTPPKITHQGHGEMVNLVRKAWGIK